MYIYIYCIYISHKKIQYLPPPQRAASVVCALGRNCPDDRFWAGFGGISAQDSSSSSPGSQTSLAGRLLSKQTSLRLLPLSWIVFFFLFFLFFFFPLFFLLFFAFLFFRN